MQHFTLDDLLEFTQKEEKMIEEVLPLSIADEEMQPSEQAVRNIIQYAQALSVRETKKLGLVRILLN